MRAAILQLLTVSICILMLLLSVQNTSVLQETDHEIHSSVGSLEFVEMSHNSIQIIKNDGGIGDLDGLTITDSVMDADGSTYVAGHFRTDDILLGQMLVDLGRGNSADAMSPIVAKFNLTGEWMWFYAPVPKQGTHCDVTDSTTNVDDAQGTANSIALHNSKLAVAGSYSGCYDATNGQRLYDADGANDGYLALLDAEDGNLSWITTIEAHALTGSGELALNATTFSNDGNTIFIGGSIKNAQVLANYSGGQTLTGDILGDAYISVHSSLDGSQEHHIDSCASNDAQSSTPCNNNGLEEIVTLDITEDLVAGIQVQSSATSISLFDSESATHGSGTDSAYAWRFDLLASYPSAYTGAPQSFGLDTAQSQKIVTSYRKGEDLLFLVDGLTEQDAAIGSLNYNSAIIFKGVPTLDRLHPLGIVHIADSESILVIEAKSTDTFSIEDQDGTVIRSITFPNHTGVMMISMDADYSRVMEYTGLRGWDSFTQVTSNGYVASLVGLDARHKGVVLAADNDLDGVPNYLDTHKNVNYEEDWDNDGVANDYDNCPYTWNVEQINHDSDHLGDLCDDDIDGDGIINSIPLDLTHASNLDICPFTYADSNLDINQDGCVDDSDGDGVVDTEDRCPNGDDSVDNDNDGFIDACDLYLDDTDNDGVDNSEDECPYTNALGQDENQNGCIDESEMQNEGDSDLDGHLIGEDNCVSSYNPSQIDTDGDGVGDACDLDIDGDGVYNTVPLNTADSNNFDACPYVDSSGMDEDQDGCIDQFEPVECEVCEEPVKGNETNTLLASGDMGAIAVVGGSGMMLGLALAYAAMKALNLVRFERTSSNGLAHMPNRKTADLYSDHYSHRGIVRQQEMTLSARMDLDDYVTEDNEGDETNE